MFCYFSCNKVKSVFNFVFCGLAENNQCRLDQMGTVIQMDLIWLLWLLMNNWCLSLVLTPIKITCWAEGKVTDGGADTIHRSRGRILWFKNWYWFWLVTYYICMLHFWSLKVWNVRFCSDFFSRLTQFSTCSRIS